MARLTPAEISQINRAAALSKAATVPDRRDLTRGARDALDARLDAQIPATVIDPLDRAERLIQLRKAHFLRLAVKSSAARRRARELYAEARAAQQELDDLDGAE